MKRTVITRAVKAQIVAAHKRGEPIEQLAYRYGMSVQRVGKIIDAARRTTS